MDLTLFHNETDTPNGDSRMKDKLNGRTGRIRCGWLEWIGWYNWNISQRLLGHYRLFQLYKKRHKPAGMDFCVERSYILHYRSTHAFKYFVSKTFNFFYMIFLKWPCPLVEIEGMNRQLINGRSDILVDFLTHADEDFKHAMETAIDQIRAADFFTPPKSTVTTLINYPDRMKGKESGVFSKKQIAIFLDVLAESENGKNIDFGKTGRHASLAELLHAITGKPGSSFMDILKDYRTRSLYGFNSDGQRAELRGILLNLFERFENAGFHKIAHLINEKIRKLG